MEVVLGTDWIDRVLFRVRSTKQTLSPGGRLSTRDKTDVTCFPDRLAGHVHVSHLNLNLFFTRGVVCKWGGIRGGIIDCKMILKPRMISLSGPPLFVYAQPIVTWVRGICHVTLRIDLFNATPLRAWAWNAESTITDWAWLKKYHQRNSLWFLVISWESGPRYSRCKGMSINQPTLTNGRTRRQECPLALCRRLDPSADKHSHWCFDFHRVSLYISLLSTL